MDKHSRHLFNDKIRDEFVLRFGGHPNQVTELDGFENFIYEIQVDGSARILRIAHSLHRNANMIAAEIDWINYLTMNGVNAACAYPSLAGQFTETILMPDGSHFTAAAFHKAAGHPPQRTDWQTWLPMSLGKLVGKMNRLAQSYNSPGADVQRPQMLDDMADFGARYLPSSQKVVIQKYEQLMQQLRTLPTTPDVYGMVHQDVHGGNFFVQDEQITLFDFDDSIYGWYVYDIAMAFMYVLPLHCQSQQDIEQGKEFLLKFLHGYTQENPISRDWLALIPLFLKIREIDLYIAIHRSMDLDNLDPWCASYMNGRRQKIENDVPYFLDPDSFINWLP